MIALIRGFIQNIAQIAKPRAKRHDMAFAQRINRRVGDLREVLAEEMMQTAIAIGQHRKGGVIAHRTRGFLAAFGHRLKQQFHVFERPSR